MARDVLASTFVLVPPWRKLQARRGCSIDLLDGLRSLLSSSQANHVSCFALPHDSSRSTVPSCASLTGLNVLFLVACAIMHMFIGPLSHLGHEHFGHLLRALALGQRLFFYQRLRAMSVAVVQSLDSPVSGLPKLWSIPSPHPLSDGQSDVAARTLSRQKLDSLQFPFVHALLNLVVQPWWPTKTLGRSIQAEWL
ncbi:hypothetical protein TRVL_02642 [Trypanosoma vivax]|nr:hypothetical protein TRVL_02642 [Trypanosoma vivax]